VRVSSQAPRKLKPSQSQHTPLGVYVVIQSPDADAIA
jgi:hypothetical protein